MIFTLYARDPGRYVFIAVDFFVGTEQKIRNDVTGYKIIADTDSGWFNSFIQRGHYPTWIPHSINAPLTPGGLKTLLYEIKQSHLHR